MGSDLISKASDSFERKQRRCMNAIDQLGLFDGFRQLSVALVATPHEDKRFRLDKAYRLALRSGEVHVFDGVTAVGLVEDPPQSVVDLLSGTCPSASVRVLKFYSLTNKVDLHILE